MKTLLITRPRDQSEQLAVVLTGMGFNTLIEPLLSVRLLEAAAPEGVHDGAVITSGYAIPSLDRMVAADCRSDYPVLSVGDATLKKLRAAGFSNSRSAGGSADDLIAEAPEYFLQQTGQSGPKLIYPCARETARDLVAVFAEGPLTVEPWPVYETIPADSFSGPIRRALISGDVDGVLLYSGRTADAYSTLFDSLLAEYDDNLRLPVLYCLSRQVADRIPHAHHNQIKIACHPDQESLLGLLHD